MIQDRHRGLVVKALDYGAEGPRIEITFNRVSGKFSVHPAANGYPPLIRAGEGLGSEGRGDGHHLLHAVPSDTCGTLTFTTPMANWQWDLPLHFTEAYCFLLYLLRLPKLWRQWPRTQKC